MSQLPAIFVKELHARDPTQSGWHVVVEGSNGTNVVLSGPHADREAAEAACIVALEQRRVERRERLTEDAGWLRNLANAIESMPLHPKSDVERLRDIAGRIAIEDG